MTFARILKQHPSHPFASYFRSLPYTIFTSHQLTSKVLTCNRADADETYSYARQTNGDKFAA
jgi:hypothetical protein